MNGPGAHDSDILHQGGGSRMSSSPIEIPSEGVLADVVAWICDSCDQNAVKGMIEGLGGKVVTDYLSTRITHFIIDVSRFTH
jgi:hypothetical protein